MSQNREADLTPNDPKLFAGLLGLMIKFTRANGRRFIAVDPLVDHVGSGPKARHEMTMSYQKAYTHDDGTVREDSRDAWGTLDSDDAPDGKRIVQMDLLGEGPSMRYQLLGYICLTSDDNEDATMLMLYPNGVILGQVAEGLETHDQRWGTPAQQPDEELGQMIRRLSRLQAYPGPQ